MKRCSLILVCLVLTGSSAIAQNFGEKDSLTGIKAISVVIEKLDSDAEAAGLSREQLQTDVELRLRKAGIPILTPTRANEVMIPELYVRVGTLKLKNVLAGAFLVTRRKSPYFSRFDELHFVICTSKTSRDALRCRLTWR